MAFFRRSIVALALMALGCGKGQGGGTAGDPKSLFPGDKPALPAQVAMVQPGMSEPELLRSHAPEVLVDRHELKLAGFDKVTFRAEPEEDRTLRKVALWMPKQGYLERLQAAWGPGKEGVDDYESKILSWFNPDTGLRARMVDNVGADLNLEFCRYVPAAQLLTELVGKGPLGKTVEELRLQYPRYVNEKPGEVPYLELPPTELAPYWTRVHWTLGEDGRVERWWTWIPFHGYPGAKEELFALFKTIGEPRPYRNEKHHLDGFVLRDSGPFVVVEENKRNDSWKVEALRHTPQL
jgi:hypothetical protein